MIDTGREDIGKGLRKAFAAAGSMTTSPRAASR
jgi:hypothetical protein